MHKIILISKESSEVRVAILENKVLEELYIEREDALKLCGNIYRGIVKAVVPGIGAAFVNLGTEKDGFLYLEEEASSDIDEISDSGFLGFNLLFKTKKPKAPVSDRLKEGQEVVVQVVKEPIRNKGPRLTRRISIPARYIVLVPGRKELGISRRIEQNAERTRIRNIFNEITWPDDAGFIVRTAAEGKSKQEFIRDIRYLMHKWKRIRTEIRRKKAPVVIHEELDLVERVIRDNFTEDVSKIIIDDKETQKKVEKFLRLYIPAYKGGVELATGKKSLFEKYNIEKEFEETFRRKVMLACKGHIVIEQTEGLVAIDVNSGRYTSTHNIEETAFRTNCEAAREVARQLRLRDVGGIIVVDFIDMEKEQHRRKVFEILEEAVRRDRAKTNVLQISKLGLVEMTRQRMRPSLESAVYDTCPYCEGRGVIKSIVTMSIKVVRDVRKALGEQMHKTVTVKANPKVVERILQQEKSSVNELEKSHKSRIHIIPDPQMHVEDVTITM